MKKISLFIIYFFISFINLFAQAGKDSPDAVKNQVEENVPEKTIFIIVEQMPEFKGGGEALDLWFKSHTIYPIEARKKGIEGIVYTDFIVTEKGEIKNAQIIKGLSKEFDDEALRLVRSMPNWTPGKQSGRTVPVRYKLPVRFSLVIKEMTYSNPNDSLDLSHVDQFPEFPGGMETLMKYLKRKVIYPLEASRRKIDGNVYLSFIIDKEGNLDSIKVEKGLCMECDEEAIRVVKKMPQWIPGKKGGVAVPVRFSLPIRFRAT